MNPSRDPANWTNRGLTRAGVGYNLINSIPSLQLLQQYTREIRKAKDVLCPNLVDKVSSAGYCDVLYVSELGSGIHRGAMGFGRLYQVILKSQN